MMNRSYIAFIILTVFMSSIAFAGKDTWLHDAASGCAIWNPNPNKHESIVWQGAVESGKASGYGIAVWRVHGKDTERTEGFWIAGKPNGYAVWSHANGSGYEGQWKDGQKTGCGIYTWPDGSAFLGEYRRDVRTHGRLFSPEGDPLKNIESAATRELVYKAQDSAIEARKAATRARLQYTNSKMEASPAPKITPPSETQEPRPEPTAASDDTASEKDPKVVTEEAAEAEEDPSAK